MQNGLRSKQAWGYLFALIVFVLKTYFKVEIPQVDTLINLILITASGFGIFKSYDEGGGTPNA